MRSMRTMGAVVVIVGCLVASSGVSSAQPANAWPHAAIAGFSTPDGRGFWTAYADGSVAANGSASVHGDAAGVALTGPIVGGALTSGGSGYWLVATDGGVFSYGDARFSGSMGALYLNQPVFSMAPTKSGRGYWLVARDGGIFSFGDARFHGSAGGIRLNLPIKGMTTSPSGRGYRLIASDGGVFSFGDAPFYGSLPGRGVGATDVVGTASTPTNRGYWVARSNGSLYAFGDAQSFGNYRASACDPVTAIFSNPKAQGYRLITQSGATVPVGAAPGGNQPTGAALRCNSDPAPASALAPLSPPKTTISRAEFNRVGTGMNYPQVVGIVGGESESSLTMSFFGHQLNARVWLGEVAETKAVIVFKDGVVATKAQVGLR